MKGKMIVIGGLCLILLNCMGSMQVKQEASKFYENYSFDEVWVASLRAIQDIGFTIKNTEKESGLIYAEGGRNVITQNESPQLNIMVIESGEKVHVDCRAVQPGQIVDYGAGKKNINKFLIALNKRLKE